MSYLSVLGAARLGTGEVRNLKGILDRLKEVHDDLSRLVILSLSTLHGVACLE